MGNCMETCRVEQVEEDDNNNIITSMPLKRSFRGSRQRGVEEERDENRGKQSKVNLCEDEVIQKDDDDSKKKSSLRVKVVVTKEELQWLMMQLSNRESGGNNKKKKIEDVLAELLKGRKRLSPGWKPSLDSISEIPEVLEMHR